MRSIHELDGGCNSECMADRGKLAPPPPRKAARPYVKSCTSLRPDMQLPPGRSESCLYRETAVSYTRPIIRLTVDMKRALPAQPQRTVLRRQTRERAYKPAQP